MNKLTKITTITEIENLNEQKLLKTLTTAFQKEINRTYLSSLQNFKTAYINSNYEAIAILCTLEESITYLDKFAVMPNKQGSGLGKEIWEILEKKHSILTWRANKKNIFNSFYKKKATEIVETTKWNLYISGASFKEYPSLIHWLTNHPESFSSTTNKP